MRTAVVILAGGEGRRIGGGKPLRILAGRTLIDHVLELAKQWSGEVAVAVRDPSQVNEVDAQLLLDREGDGPIAGVASALAFAEAGGFDAVLTVPIDTPLLPPDLLQRLADAASPVAVPSSGGRLHPASSLWRTDAGAQLPAYLATGRRSIMGLAEQVGYAAVAWPDAPLDPFLNINSPEDLAAAEAILRNR